jgi:hypothetical protein
MSIINHVDMSIMVTTSHCALCPCVFNRVHKFIVLLDHHRVLTSPQDTPYPARPGLGVAPGKRPFARSQLCKVTPRASRVEFARYVKKEKV